MESDYGLRPIDPGAPVSVTPDVDAGGMRGTVIVQAPGLYWSFSFSTVCLGA